MPSLNKAIIIGHLGRDPDVHEKFTTFSVATSEVWRDKTTGEKKEQTEWHDIVFFGKTADIAAQYLQKGALVYVEGRLQTDSYEKNGVKHYRTKIIGRELKMFPSKTDTQRSNPPQSPSQAPPKQDFDDNLPF